MKFALNSGCHPHPDPYLRTIEAYFNIARQGKWIQIRRLVRSQRSSSLLLFDVMALACGAIVETSNV